MTFAPIIAWPFIAVSVVATLLFTVWVLARGGQPRQAVRSTAVRCAAVVLLLLAALRPGWPGGEATTASTDLDVFFVVDTSTSMAAEDFNGSATRLSGVSADVMAIAKELAGAKFSLITFDSKASVRMPLTRDTTALQTAMATLQPQSPRYARGSSVTGAGPLLKERLHKAREQHPGRPALVFYAGDGENTSAGPPDALPLGPSETAGGAVLGYGTDQGGRMRDASGSGAGYLQDRSGDGPRDAVSRIDETQLQEIAGQLNVPYVHRDGTGPASDLFTKAEPGTLVPGGEDRSPGRTELYWLLALAAFLLAMQEPLRHVAGLRQLSRPGSAAPQPGDREAL
ncbi:vWA domain-containing protein [Paenarthrobacter sp. NyZ202]|uniref:vWA domain-containing protein n=1 Tax=Paenarthrobacter sp. NyZ202 TaxID=3402689 RepID=UPI003CFACE1F